MIAGLLAKRPMTQDQRERLPAMGMRGCYRHFLDALFGLGSPELSGAFVYKRVEAACILPSPFLRPEIREALTTRLPRYVVQRSAFVAVVSEKAMIKKLCALAKGRENRVWFNRLRQWCVILDGTEDVVTMLPTVLNPEWQSLLATMIQRTDQAAKLASFPVKSIEHLPRFVIG